MRMKNSALSGDRGKGSAAKGMNGFKLLHLLLVAIVSLIIGALIK